MSQLPRLVHRLRFAFFMCLLMSFASSARAAHPVVDLAAAKDVLHVAAECDSVACLIDAAYHADARAAALALSLWQDSGDVPGVGSEELMDGGFRGTIHLVPELPVGRYRRHLSWVKSATVKIGDFFGALFADLPPPPYRFQALQFRFVRSLDKHRPSAYALGWAIEYNVEGSLNIDEKSVRETLFHELFHLNDQAHGRWSAAHLRQDYQAILTKCGPHPSIKCLAPYAPNDTMVRGGTFYAFQQNNGDTVEEYAAELAVRYFKEQSEMLKAHKLSRPAFKCGPAENARAWQAVVSEFFSGRDLVPPC